ncbi:MAG: LPS export ABC transporter permease LptG [Gammaproteobacteria bacterium]
MKLLQRYIGKAVIVNIIIALVVLLGLVSIGTFANELGDVGRGRYQTYDAFVYVMMIVPRRTYEVFPVAVLLGSLIGLGGLASNSELIAMRAAGVSLREIIFSALKAGIVMMVIIVVVGELIAPNTEQYAQTMRASKMSEQITLKSEYGFWARDRNTFVNIRNILPGARLQDIYIYEFSDDRQLKVASYAAFAQFRNDRWLLNNIKQTEFTPKGVVSRQIERAEWESMLDPGVLSVVVVRPTMLAAWGLYRYISFLHGNGQTAIPFEVAFWSKIVSPVMTLVMVFLAVPFVFGSLRSVGIGQRVFAGSIIGTVFFLMSKILGHLAVVYQLNPLFAATFPAFVMLGLAFWLFRKVH